MAHTRIWMCESHIESGYKDVRCRSLTCSGIVREPRAHVSSRTLFVILSRPCQRDTCVLLLS